MRKRFVLALSCAAFVALAAAPGSHVKRWPGVENRVVHWWFRPDHDMTMSRDLHGDGVWLVGPSMMRHTNSAGTVRDVRFICRGDVGHGWCESWAGPNAALIRISMRTGRVEMRVPLARTPDQVPYLIPSAPNFPDPRGVTVGPDGIVWFIEPQGQAVGAFDGRRLHIWPIQPAAPTAIAARNGYALVAAGQAGMVFRVAVGGEPVAVRLRTRADISSVSWDGDAWWFGGDGAIVRWDAHGQSVWRVPGREVTRLAPYGGGLWFIAETPRMEWGQELAHLGSDGHVHYMKTPTLVYDVTTDSDGNLWLLADNPDVLIELVRNDAP